MSTAAGRVRLLKEIEVQIAASHGAGVYSAAKCLEDSRVVIRELDAVAIKAEAHENELTVLINTMTEQSEGYNRHRGELLEANNRYLELSRHSYRVACEREQDNIGLRRLLSECADKLERAIILTGTTQEYAALAVADYRPAIDGGL